METSLRSLRNEWKKGRLGNGGRGREMRGEGAYTWKGAGARRGGAENRAPELGRGYGYARFA